MTERAFWLAWSQIPNVGGILSQRLQHHFGSLEVAWQADANELMAVEGFGVQMAEAVVKARAKFEPLEFLEQHQQGNPHFWTPADSDYPRWLREIPDLPLVLYYRGKVEPLENRGILPAVAIVGTRGPTDYGRRWARRLSATLAQVGFTIVSGLAEGIDTEAHQSCIAVGGRTVAVLGTGVDQVYPYFNRNLSKQIVKQGLLVSEFPAGTQPDRGHFPRRNRIIAGLCRATLVIEAPQKSGSLITARLANDYGREVYALPGTLDNPKARGCLLLLSQGAQMILSEAELVDMLGNLPTLQQPVPTQLSLLTMPVASVSTSGSAPVDLEAAVASVRPKSIHPEPTDLEPELQQVLQAVASEPATFDLIVEKAGLTTSSVLSALVQLELMGLVSQLPGMRYQRGG